MLSNIAKRTIHQKAASPIFNIVDYILKQRWSYLGEESMFADSHSRTKDGIIEAASNRKEWRR